MENLIHIQEEEFEVVLNPNSIAYIVKMGPNVFIHFKGDPDRLNLNKESGKIFWNKMRNFSETIYSPPAQNENPFSFPDENAET